MAASFEIKGTKAMQRKIERIARDFPNKVEQLLRIEAELVMTDSKKNFVPVDLGTLRSSGHVGDVERSGRDLSVTLDYGGAAAPYALAVHEHPSASSPPSWEGKAVTDISNWSVDGRGPKYLERPLMSAVAGMARRIAASLRTRDTRGRFVRES
jgi:hypothetical protein